MHSNSSTTRYACVFAIGGLLSIVGFLLLTHITAFMLLPVGDNQVKRQLNTAILVQHEQHDISSELAVASAIHNHFPYADNIQELPFWIVSASEAKGINPLLLTALFAQESSFRSDAISPVGAIGYGQVIPRFWEESCGLDVSTAYNNIWCSAHALKTYIDRYGSLPQALAVYNVGPSNYRNAHYRAAGYRYASSVLDYQAEFMGGRKVALTF